MLKHDGSAWNIIASFNSFTSGWATQSVDLTGYDVAGIVSKIQRKFRFK